MDKVRTHRLRQVDASEWADRLKLFVDFYGGWDVVEYMFWVERQADIYKGERGVGGIVDHDDFDAFLREQIVKAKGMKPMP